MNTYPTREEAITGEITELIQALENDDFDNITTEENTVTVTHDNEYSAEITPKYSNDGYAWYLTRYDVVWTTPEGETEEWWYSNLDLLCAALKKQEAIDPDEIKQAFVKQVDGLFDNDVWRLDQSWLSDMVAHWGPVDWDEDSYRGKVDAMGIRAVQIGPFGDVEAVEMLGMGDFYGEETDALSGGDLAWKAATWLSEEMDSCGLDAHGR